MTDPQAGRGPVTVVGARALDAAAYVGGMWLLLVESTRWLLLGLFTRRARFDLGAVSSQVIRLGVRSVGIVLGVQFFVGVILVLQMAPPLAPFGQVSMVADIIGVAFFRELGPLLAAVVLSGFAGASIAAELGVMVVGEEVEALKAHAIHPVRFLVVPRLIATVIAMVGLCVLSDVAGCLGGYVSCLAAVGPDAYQAYWVHIHQQVTFLDFATGLIKASVFGLILGLLACHEGLKVREGAEGVGRATTMTVVYTIVSLVIVDCLFTVIFYVYGW